MLSGERTGRLALGLAGVLSTLVMWKLLAETLFTPAQVPPPEAVMNVIGDRGFGYYQRIFSVTLREAGQGYVFGVGLALATAALVMLWPVVEPVVMQLAVVTYCLPIVVMAPILITIHEIPAKGATSPTAIDLAAVSVFFTTVVGAVVGFRTAEQSTLDVVAVYGGGRLQSFWRVRAVSALPAVFTTLQIAAPAAFLGALLGEYFDRHLEIGVGPSLILGQNNRETALVWSLGIGCAVVSGVAYALLGVAGRAATPWSRDPTR